MIKLVDFTGRWCSSCQKVDQTLESEILPKVGDELEFERVEIPGQEERANEFDVLSVPTLVLLEDGEEIWRNQGLVSAEEIMRNVEKALTDRSG